MIDAETMIDRIAAADSLGDLEALRVDGVAEQLVEQLDDPLLLVAACRVGEGGLVVG